MSLTRIMNIKGEENIIIIVFSQLEKKKKEKEY